jgi:predicted RNase H-like HicB family nuclease
MNPVSTRHWPAPPEGEDPMKHEFTAVIEQDGDWYIAWCPEIPGANGQGQTREACKQNLAEAIALILQDRLEDGLRGVPEDAECDVVTVE